MHLHNLVLHPRTMGFEAGERAPGREFGGLFLEAAAGRRADGETPKFFRFALVLIRIRPKLSRSSETKARLARRSLREGGGLTRTVDWKEHGLA
jgi:hypothetical protein